MQMFGDKRNRTGGNPGYLLSVLRDKVNHLRLLQLAEYRLSRWHALQTHRLIDQRPTIIPKTALRKSGAESPLPAAPEFFLLFPAPVGDERGLRGRVVSGTENF